MTLYVKLYKDTDNPFNLPEDYPADAVELDKDPGPPWVQMERREYESLVAKSQDIARTLIDQKKAEKSSSDAQKLDALKRLFDDGKVIMDAWPNLTNSQKLDLVPIVFDLLFKQRRQILDQYRPE